MSKALQTKIAKLRSQLAAAELEQQRLEDFEKEAADLRKVWEPRGYALIRKPAKVPGLTRKQKKEKEVKPELAPNKPNGFTAPSIPENSKPAVNCG